MQKESLMNSSNSAVKKGLLINVVSVVCNSIAPIFNKFALVSLDAMEAAFWGTLLTTVLTLLFWSFKRFEISWRLARQLWPIALCNALGVLCLYLALARLNPVTFGFMGRLYIVFTTALSVLILKETVARREWLLIVAAIVGAVLVGTKSASVGDSTTGVLFAIAYTFLFATSNMLVKQTLKSANPMSILFFNNVMALIVVTVLFAVSGLHFHQFNWEVAGFVGGSAVFTFLALATLFVGFGHLSFRLANLIRATSPLLIAGFSWPFFPVHLNASNLSGGVLLVFSILGLGMLERAKK
jgi:drug/metabolite transporter (DMT)-like permease